MLHIFHSLLFHFLLSTPDFYCVLILLHNLHSFRFQFLSTPDFSSQKTAQRWGFYWKYKMITGCFLQNLPPTASGRGTGAGIYVHILAPSDRFQNFHQRARVFPKPDVSAVPPSRAGLGHYIHLTYSILHAHVSRAIERNFY